jgi:predicted nucleotide-binding protein
MSFGYLRDTSTPAKWSSRQNPSRFSSGTNEPLNGEIAYEIGPRAGLSIKEVLEDMLNKSSFALLVLTGEDEHADGEIHARENVIHELGLFQGNIGFTRAIALLEEGVKEFSNILGINQIRFSKGNIREVYGDVIASMRREFEAEKD